MAHIQKLLIPRRAALAVLATVMVLTLGCENPVQDYLHSPNIKLLGGTLTIAVDGQFDFGHVEVAGSVREVVFTVKNVGNSGMTLQDIVTISGLDTGNYQMTEPLSRTDIPAGGSATFTIKFDPFSEGTKTAAVTVICNDPDTPVFSFTIVGTGDAAPPQPEIQVTQGGTLYESDGNVYDFSGVPSGFSSSAITFTINSQSGADLVVDSISIGDPVNYTLAAPSTPATIPGFGSETFEITFNPITVGTKDTTVVIDNNDATGNEDPYILKLTGMGLATVPEISVLQAGTPYQSNGTPYDFGTLPEGFSRDPVAFRIRNDGTGDLTVISVSLADTNNFVLTPPSLPFTLPPNGTRDFTTAFSPDAVSIYNSSIVIASSDSDELTFYLNITGEGVVQETIHVSSTSPADGALDVPINGNITITFDRSIDPSSITGTTIQQGAVTYSYTWSYDDPSRTITLDPDSQFAYQSDVTVTLPTSITGGNYELFDGYSFSFTTLTPWHDGNTIFVSTTGTTGNPGTKAQPVKSIQEGLGLAVAQGYDQVYVETGTYSYSNGGLEASPTAGVHITNPVTVIGGWNSTFTAYSGVNSTLDAESNSDHVVHIESSDVNLEYLKISGADSLGYGGGIYINSTVVQSNINVTNVTVEFNSAAFGAGIYIDALSRYVTFTDCIVRNNTASMRGGGFQITTYTYHPTLNNIEIRDNIGEGIYSSRTWSMTITGCTVHNNSGAAGIYMGDGSSTILSSTSIRQDDICLYLNSNSGDSDPHDGLVIDGCSFGATAASTTAIAVKEGQSDVHGHTFTNNEFLPDNLGYLYEDWYNSGNPATTPDTSAGLTIMNTAVHPDHDASPASGNIFVY